MWLTLSRRFCIIDYIQIADRIGNAYVWDPTEPVATRPLVWNRNGESGFYTYDGKKNVSEVVSPDGSIAAHYDYAPFGTVESVIANAAILAFSFAETVRASVALVAVHPAVVRLVRDGLGAPAHVLSDSANRPSEFGKEPKTLPVA